MGGTVHLDNANALWKRVEESKLYTPDAPDQQSELLERLPSHLLVGLESTQVSWE